METDSCYSTVIISWDVILNLGPVALFKKPATRDPHSSSPLSNLKKSAVSISPGVMWPRALSSGSAHPSIFIKQVL